MARPVATRDLPLYGLDIETDTVVDGLDPVLSPVAAVALSTPATDEVFTGEEVDVLRRLDGRLRALPRGILTTWNGAAFDLPFLADRAAIRGVRLGLRLEPDPFVLSQSDPLVGHVAVYRATWHRHRHLDAYRAYQSDVGPALRISCSLKSIARLAGFRPVEVDRQHIHDLASDELEAYVASDARLARLLAERRRPGIDRWVDGPDLSHPLARVPRTGS